MAFRQRLGILGLLGLLALAADGVGRYYSPALMGYVVEQTLIEKSPSGTDQAMLRSRFEALLSTSRSREDKYQILLRLSQHLEKVQALTKPELEMLLQERPEKSDTRTPEISWNFFCTANV